jgi:ComF family protein
MKQCLLCLDYSKENICIPCKADLPWIKSSCPGCGRHSELVNLCAICQKEPALWNKGLAPLLYQPPVVNLVSGLKFSRLFFQARTLTDLFLEALPPGPLPQLLLPVPLHPWRMLWRGFNQSTELARLLSKGLGIPYSPYYLKRIKHTAAQRGSDKQTRKSNITRAFVLKRPLPVSHIALIDDVLTTGETLSEICRAIRSIHPDIRIDVWAMAQVGLASNKGQ